MEQERLDLIVKLEEAEKLISRDFLSPSGAVLAQLGLALAKEFVRQDTRADLPYVEEKLDGLRAWIRGERARRREGKDLEGS